MRAAGGETHQPERAEQWTRSGSASFENRVETEKRPRCPHLALRFPGGSHITAAEPQGSRKDRGALPPPVSKLLTQVTKSVLHMTVQNPQRTLCTGHSRFPDYKRGGSQTSGPGGSPQGREKRAVTRIPGTWCFRDRQESGRGWESAQGGSREWRALGEVELTFKEEGAGKRLKYCKAVQDTKVSKVLSTETAGDLW